MKRPSPTRRKLALLLADGEQMPLRKIVEISGWDYRATYELARTMLLEGLIKQPKRGVYCVE